MKTYTKLIMLYAVILTATAAFLFSGYGDWKRVSPFTDVKIKDGQIITQFEGKFYLLKSIEGISSDALIDASKRAYDEQWKKRIREDIAEVLVEAGAPESNHVNLVLSNLETGQDLIVESAPMTKANRDKIYSGS